MEQKNEPTKNETLFGGLDLEVELLDGKKELVKLRQLPISAIPRLAEVFERDEAAEIALLTGRPKDFADNLKIESAELIIAEGERVNAAPLKRWFQRKVAKLELLSPALAEKVKAGISPTT